MIYFLSLLLLFQSTLINYETSDKFYHSEDLAVSNQLFNYLVEYENNENSITLWFVYLILNSVEDSYAILQNLASTNNNLIKAKEIYNCIENSKTLYPLIKHDALFAKCSNDEIIKLAHLYNIDKKHDSYKLIYDSIDYNVLSPKQKHHYRYLTHGHGFEDYNISHDNLCVLDFYYIDNITDIASNNKANAIYHEIKTTSIELGKLDSIHDKYFFIFTINLFYKLDQEYKVHNLSRNILNHYDLPFSNLYLRILNYISYSSYINGYYQYDIDLYRNFILPLARVLSTEAYVKANIDYGASLYRIGNTSKALSIFESLYDDKTLLSKTFDTRYYSALLNNLGISYLNVGYFEKYIQLQLEALEFSEMHGDINQHVAILNNLYIYHLRLQNWNTAIEYLQQVRSKVSMAKDNMLLAEFEATFGVFHRDYTRDINLAIEHFNKSIELAQLTDHYHALVLSLIELASTYKDINEFNLSYSLYKEASKLAKEKDDELIFVYNYTQIANLLLNKGDLRKANYYLSHVLDFDKSKMNFRNQVDRENVISRSLLYQNKIDDAFIILRNYAENIIKRAIHSSDIQSGHIYLQEEYLSLFKLFIYHLVKYENHQEAIYWMDEIKNLSSVTFYNNPALKASILNENELVLDFALRNRIERLRSELRTSSDDKRVQLNNLLIKATSEQNTLRRKVLQNVDFEPVNMNRLRRELGRSDIILYFSIFHEDLYVSKITSGSFDIQKITFSDEDFNRIEGIVESLSSDKVRLTELAWLKEKILGNNGIPDRYTNYFIIPDGFLYHVPFEIFPIGNVTSDYSYGEATYLIEHAAISYSNSLKDLNASLNHKPQRKYALDFVGFGITHFNNPESQLLPGRYLPALPLAEREVEDISANLNSFSNNIFFDSNTATETSFRQNSGNGRILHFATHSEVFENDPLYSVIYLNQENGENRIVDSSNDGFVYAYELFQMDLSSEMVMLNSCESGSGNYIQGSGVVGFSRAFNYAGIPSLVMNLWSVRDRSAYHLSVSFYDYLNQGYSKNEAMRKAKIYYLNKFNSNPTNWGSFVVYGNIDPITPKRNPWTLAAVFLIIGGISLIVVWLRLPAKVRQRLQ